MVAVYAMSRLLSVWEVCWVLVEVDGLPSWYIYEYAQFMQGAEREACDN